MKRFIISLTIIFATVGVLNAQTVKVTLNKQYSDTSGFVLPQKTIEKKMPLMTIANTKYDFTVKLLEIARRIANDDNDNRVFTMMLQFSGVGISIVIDSQDVLDLTDTKFYGDLLVDRHHFVLLENEDNKNLLKTYFKKAKVKDVLFERTFEVVPSIIQTEPTHYNAIYDERKRSINEKEVIINNNDKLHISREPVTTAPKQDSNDEDNDAFKIDVELFNE